MSTTEYLAAPSGNGYFGLKPEGGLELLLDARSHDRCRYPGLVQQSGQGFVARFLAQLDAEFLVLADYPGAS